MGSDQPSRRWEFRCWLDDASAERLAARLTLAELRERPAEERTDRYLLPPGRPDLLPKLRDLDRLEVKRRLDLCDSCELWEQVWSGDWPPPAGDHAPLTDLLGVQPDPAWLTADLHKRRRRWDTGAWTLEVTAVTGDRSGWTAAWEGPEPRHPPVFANDAACALPNLDYGAWLWIGAAGSRGGRTMA